MKSRTILIILLSIMAAMVIAALAFPTVLEEFLNRPAMHRHVLFVHIVSVTLFFANAIVGILWELRSLASGRKEIILHTYNTVTWLDARFSVPMIILSVSAGIVLSIMMGDIWRIGWLSVAFLLFVFSGLVYVSGDIPTQYRIKRLARNVDPTQHDLPPELMRLLKIRVWISIGDVLPLIVVFVLMVYKPEIVPVAEWFQR